MSDLDALLASANPLTNEHTELIQAAVVQASVRMRPVEFIDRVLPVMLGGLLAAATVGERGRAELMARETLRTVVRRCLK